MQREHKHLQMEFESDSSDFYDDCHFIKIVRQKDAHKRTKI